MLTNLFVLVTVKLFAGSAHKCYVCAPDSAKEEDIAQVKILQYQIKKKILDKKEIGNIEIKIKILPR